jgi:hypothetical protein
MTVIPLPRHGRWAWDLRGEGRGVRVSAHADEGLLNVSLWREGTCVGTAQLLPVDVAKLVSGLSEGLAEIAAQRSAPGAGSDVTRLHELEQRLAEVEARVRPPFGERAGAVVRSARTAMSRRAASATLLMGRGRTSAERRDGGSEGS